MAGVPTLGGEISDYDAATGATDPSADPWTTSNWGGTGVGSFSDFNNYQDQQLGYVPNYGSANVNANSTPLNASSAPAAAGGTPTGLPTSTDVAAMAPAPLQSFGATPSVTPTYANATTYQASTVNPAYNQQYLNEQEQANSAALQPTFQAQDQTNQDQLAARGISSSGAAQDLTNQLYGQQAATLASADSSAIGQQAGNVQSDISANQSALNAAGQYNAGNIQGTNITNVNSANAATAANAGYYDQALTGNATTYNNYLSTLEGQGYNTSNEAYTAYLNSFGPNSGVTSAYGAATSGIGNAATGAYDSSVAGEGAALGGLFGGLGQTAAAGKL
jgi:hypothetical protein